MLVGNPAGKEYRTIHLFYTVRFPFIMYFPVSNVLSYYYGLYVYDPPPQFISQNLHIQCDGIRR